MGKIGNFNLDFPGAIIYCDSSEKRNAILDFVNNRKDGIEIDANFHNIDEAIDRALYNTTYVHEGKHLHDHLVCPMLFHNYVLKLSSLFYSSLLIQNWDLGVRPYKYLPLPFTKWLELSIERKKELIEEKGISPSEVPIFSLKDAAFVLRSEQDCEDNFTKALLLGSIHNSEYWYNIKQSSHDGYNMEFSVRTFTEGLAYIQQVTELALKYGLEGESVQHKILEYSFENFQRIGKQIRDSGRTTSNDDNIGFSVYTVVFTMAWRYAIQNKMDINYIYPFISYVLFWSLSPNILFDRKDSSSPRLRMEKLFNLDYVGVDLCLNKEKELFNLFKDPLNTFHKWDKNIGELYLGTNIRIRSLSNIENLDIPSSPINYKNTYNSFLQSLMQMINHLYSIGYKETADYIYNIANAMYSMSTGFISNPSLYLYPESYSKYINEFVNVPFRIEFTGVDPIRSGECKFKREGVSIIDDYIYGNTLRVNSDENTMIDWQVYHKAEKYIKFAESLYGYPQFNMPGMVIKDFLPGIKTWFFDR